MADLLALVLLAALGLAGGVAGGMFGVGGGIVVVPALVLAGGVEFHVAKAASLLVIALGTALGIWQHRRQGNVDLRLGLLLAAGGVAGSLLAVYMAQAVGAQQLRGAFGLVLVATGARLWFDVRARGGHAQALRKLAPLLGFAAGILGGLFGIGGGLLMVPAMVLLGVAVHTAVGTSLVAVLLSAASGSVGHLQLGYGPAIVGLAVPLAVGSGLGIVAGARVAGKVAAPSLRKGFGVFLAAVGVFMATTSL